MADDDEKALLLRFRIGQRIHAAGNPQRTGTVRYVGPVDGHAGEWVGVDWDDGEGKHDGDVNGVRYFSARGERSASLVRAKNLSAGISLIDALCTRYRSDTTTTKEEEDEMYVHSMSNKRVQIQLVGKHKVEEKLKRLDEICSMSTAYLGVSSVGSSHEITALVPKLKELDLTGNLLSKWQDITSICKALPALEVLNLTRNSLEDDIDVAELSLLCRIRVLVLNNCGVTWEQVEKLKPSLESIEELHLMANNLQSIVPSPPPTKFVEGFDSLHLLSLEDNFIDDWDEVVKLCHLRSLEQLHLNNNNLKRIYYPANPASLDSTKIDSRCDRAFKNLKCLLLGSNQIEDLASIDSLNFFPNLLDVRLSGNPIDDPAKGGVPRFALIARLGKIKILNGSEVTSRERRESEIRYVRLVMAKMQAENLAEIEQLHPRFSELKLLHGIDDEKPATGTAGPQKMSAGLLCITLKCVGPSMGEKLPLTKKLPPNTTVGRLKALCESFFKLKGIRPRLFIQEEGSPLPQFLDDDMASLLDLGFGSEATILVDEESS
ncbi:Ubiquitin-like protein [Dioscorea alata]|uniref:Ubiquitin-like protein n=2 Tax=Dioscorea alata TaxID=55571 RepID=A0ACB7W1W5_DIOAL|nr:Ubiquitin-like protein [Dioscorea alata]KAH7681406.1 Ubiquitin-like protein [Dioscorea alata]